MNGMDIVEYLKITGEENNDTIISQWGEGIAYQLYSTKGYQSLHGYVLDYIYEIVIENMKVNFFQKDFGQVGLQYLQTGEMNIMGISMRGRVLTREVNVTRTKDMRDYGEEHFIEFIQYYIQTILKEMFETERYVYTYNLQEKLEGIIQFLVFIQMSGKEVLSEGGYDELKEFINHQLAKGIKEIETENTIDTMHYRRLEYVQEGILECFKREEEMDTI